MDSMRLAERQRLARLESIMSNDYFTVSAPEQIGAFTGAPTERWVPSGTTAPIKLTLNFGGGIVRYRVKSIRTGAYLYDGTSHIAPITLQYTGTNSSTYNKNDGWNPLQIEECLNSSCTSLNIRSLTIHADSMNAPLMVVSTGVFGMLVDPQISGDCMVDMYHISDSSDELCVRVIHLDDGSFLQRSVGDVDIGFSFSSDSQVNNAITTAENIYLTINRLRQTQDEIDLCDDEPLECTLYHLAGAEATLQVMKCDPPPEESENVQINNAIRHVVFSSVLSKAFYENGYTPASAASARAKVWLDAHEAKAGQTGCVSPTAPDEVADCHHNELGYDVFESMPNSSWEDIASEAYGELVQKPSPGLQNTTGNSGITNAMVDLCFIQP